MPQRQRRQRGWGGDSPHWVRHRLREVAIPIFLLVAGLDAILLVAYALGGTVLDLILALGVTVGFPWLLLAVPRGWRGGWSLDMVIEGPGSQTEGPELWTALCEGLRSRGIVLEDVAALAAVEVGGRSEASVYVGAYGSRLRLVNVLAGKGSGQPILFSHLILDPDDKNRDPKELRGLLTEVLSRERQRYRDEAIQKGYLRQELGRSPPERLN